MFKLKSYLKPYWIVTVLAPILMFIEVACDLFQPKLMASIIDYGIYNGDTSFIIKTTFIMIGITLLGVIGGVGCAITASIAAMNFGADIRSAVYKKIQRFSFANLDKFNTGSLITRLTNDIVQVQNMVMMLLRMFVRSPLLFIGGIVLAVSINARLSLIFLVAIPTLILAVAILINMSFPLFTKLQQKLDKVNSVIRENLIGVRVVKAFVRADFENSRFNTASKDLSDITVKSSRLMSLIMPIMMLVMNLSIIAVIWFGGIQINKGTMKVGEIVAYITYMTQILSSLLMIGMALVNFSRAYASSERIVEVLASEIDIEDLPNASKEPIRAGGIVFDNVSFRYKDALGEPVLKNISLQQIREKLLPFSEEQVLENQL